MIPGSYPSRSTAPHPGPGTPSPSFETKSFLFLAGWAILFRKVRKLKMTGMYFPPLNFPPEHPARDMQDTFFIEKDPDILLRTHTSSVQVRVMEKESLPIRTISPGRVFRNEAISARAHCIFHQVEGLYIDENVSFADLKQTLLLFRQGNVWEKRGNPATAFLSFHSQNLRRKWISVVRSVAVRGAMYVNTRAGWKSLVVAWSIPMCWNLMI